MIKRSVSKLSNGSIQDFTSEPGIDMIFTYLHNDRINISAMRTPKVLLPPINDLSFNVSTSLGSLSFEDDKTIAIHKILSNYDESDINLGVRNLTEKIDLTFDKISKKYIYSFKNGNLEDIESSVFSSDTFQIFTEYKDFIPTHMMIADTSKLYDVYFRKNESTSKINTTIFPSLITKIKTKYNEYNFIYTKEKLMFVVDGNNKIITTSTVNANGSTIKIPIIKCGIGITSIINCDSMIINYKDNGAISYIYY